MKVWITRPYSQEVYMGGMRHVALWVSKPRYDHRLHHATHEYLTMDDPPKRVATVYKECGWRTHEGSISAKKFLKQNDVMFEEVWDRIYDSLKPMGYEAEHMSESEYELLHIDSYYETKCNVSFKRFLLEIDLETNIVTQVIPDVIMSDKRPCEPGELNPTDSNWVVNDHYFDEDHSRPWLYREFDSSAYAINTDCWF